MDKKMFSSYSFIMSRNILFSFILLTIFVLPGFSKAASNWDSMEANDFLYATYDSLTQSSSTEVSVLNAVYAYKNEEDTKPSFIGTFINGLVIDSISTPIVKYDATSTFEFGKGTKSNGFEMKVRSDGTYVYVLFHLTESKKLKNKWIKMTPEEYTQLGKKTNLEPLFDALKPEQLISVKDRSKESLDIMLKSNLLTVYPFTIDDNFTMNNATRYNFEYNEDNIRSYVTDMLKFQTKNYPNKDTSTYKLLNKIIRKDEAVEYIADGSYLSIWIDKTTQRPVRITNSFWFSETTGKKVKPVQILTDTVIDKYQSTKTVTTPTSTISFADAAKIMKLKLDKPKK